MPKTEDGVQKLLDRLDGDSLKSLCERSDLRAGRSRRDRIDRLTVLYDGFFERMLEGLRKADLETALNGHAFRLGPKTLELGRVHGVRIDDLRRVAKAVFADGWVPRHDEDVPVPGVAIRVYEVVAEDGGPIGRGERTDADDEPEGERYGRSHKTKEPIDPFATGPNDRGDAQLEPFQRDAVAALARHFADAGARGMLCLPTGGGKTRTSLEWLLTQFVAKRRRVLWVTHRIDLLIQVMDDIKGLAWLVRDTRPDGFAISHYHGDHDDLSGDIVLASAQTLASRSPNRAELSVGMDLGIVVYDEAHRAVADGTWRSLRMILGQPRRVVPFLGLTATPFRIDDDETRELLEQVGEPIYRRTFKDLVDLGFLASPIFYRQEILSRGVETMTRDEVAAARRLRDIPASVLSKLARDAPRNAQIVVTWLARRDVFGKTLVFACDIDHADALTNQFRRAGVKAEVIYSGSVSFEQRKQRIDAFRHGDVEVLVNVGILTEGANIPNTQTVLLARPTMSESLYLQMIGRGARGPRVVPGKRTFNVIDCVDNFAQHGLTLAGRDLAASLSEDSGVSAAPKAPLQPGERAPAAAERTRLASRDVMRVLAFLRSRGFALEQCTFWGELRWTGPKGPASIAVFAETIAPIGRAIELIHEAHASGRWTAAFDQGPSLDVYSAVRASDWKRVVEDCRAAGSTPELVPVAPQSYEDEIPAAEQLLGLARQVAALSFAAATAAIREAYAGSEDFRGRFASESEFRDEIVGLCASIEIQAPRPPVWVDPVADKVRAALAFAEFGFGLARVDGPVVESERIAFGCALDHLFDLGANAIETELASELQAIETRPSAPYQEVVDRVRTALDWSTRLAAYDWLFRIAVADGPLVDGEIRVLRHAVDAFELQHAVFAERVAWYGEARASDVEASWQGYVACPTCSAAWEARVNFCGECGTDLRVNRAT